MGWGVLGSLLLGGTHVARSIPIVSLDTISEAVTVNICPQVLMIDICPKVRRS